MFTYRAIEKFKFNTFMNFFNSFNYIDDLFENNLFYFLDTDSSYEP